VAAATVSGYGDFLTTVALMVALFQFTGSAAAPAGYMVARLVPRVLGPMPGGWLADRACPAALLISAWSTRAALSAALAAAVVARSLGWIFALVAVSQLIAGLSRPAEAALIPLVTPRGQLPRVNAIYGGLQASAIFIAPALGALLLHPFGAPWLLVVDAVTFAAGVPVVAWLRRLPPATPGASARPASQRQGARGTSFWALLTYLWVIRVDVPGVGGCDRPG
jgi:MFS family permease